MNLEFVVGVVIAWLVVRWSVQWYFEQRGWIPVEPAQTPPVFVRVVARTRALPERLVRRWIPATPATPTLPQEQVLEADVVAEESAPPAPDEETASATVIEIEDASFADETTRVVTPPPSAEPVAEPTGETPDEEIPAAESDTITLTPTDGESEDGAVPAPLFLYVEAYCPTCRTQRPLVDPEEVAPDDEHAGVRGLCPICGGELFATLDDHT